jgi:hypothetical protein
MVFLLSMLSPSSAAVLAPAGDSHPQGVDTDIPSGFNPVGKSLVTSATKKL